MAGWGEYAAAWLVFLLSHMLPARPALRRPLVAALGERAYLLLYSAASLAVLAWLISAAGRAPFVPLWDWAAWQGWVPRAVMPAACVLLALSIGRPNPFSIGGMGNDRFDPGRPGILRVTRHPVLWAMALWAGAHVPPNGDLAHLLLFGSFAGLALLGMRALDARRRRAWGEAGWLAMTGGGAAPRAGEGAASASLRIALGLLLFGLLFLAHGPVIGISPWP